MQLLVADFRLRPTSDGAIYFVGDELWSEQIPGQGGVDDRRLCLLRSAAGGLTDA